MYAPVPAPKFHLVAIRAAIAAWLDPGLTAEVVTWRAAARNSR